MNARHAEMDQIIVRYLQGEISEQDAAALRRWRSASPENEQYFEAAVKIWQEVPEPSVDTESPRAATVIALARERERAHADARRPRTAPVLAAATSILLVVAIPFMVLDRDRGVAPGYELAATDITTGTDETRPTQLADGSIVHLGPNSRLQVPQNTGAREVWIEGRAFLGVARRDDRPFIVRSSVGQVEVLGTRFDLRAEEEETTVAVSDGRGALQAAGGRAEVVAGHISSALVGRPGP